MRHAVRLGWVPGVAVAAIAAGCIGFAVPEPTNPPLGAPFEACSTEPASNVEEPDGRTFVPPGTIAIGYTIVHFEGTASDACGAVFVEGASTIVHRSDLPTPDIGIPVVASLRRARPLTVRDPERPTTRVFRIDGSGLALAMIDSEQLQNDPQYQAWGWTLPGAPIGRYRLQVVASDGEVLADGTFQVVD